MPNTCKLQIDNLFSVKVSNIYMFNNFFLKIFTIKLKKMDTESKKEFTRKRNELDSITKLLDKLVRTRIENI